MSQTDTSNPKHASQILAALRGPRPQPAMRRRVARHRERMVGFGQLASMPWDPDKHAPYRGVIWRAQGAWRSWL